MVDTAFWMPLVTAAVGLPVSAVVAGWRRSQPWAALALHAGLWLIACAVWTAVLGRPVFAAMLALSHWTTVAVVDRSKQQTLRERFVIQDFEYFPDTLRHPMLYLPFLGWANFIMSASVTISAITVGFLVESVPAIRDGQWLAVGSMIALGCSLLVWGNRQRLDITLDPAIDIARLGMTASLWRYAQEFRRPMPPITKLETATARPGTNATDPLPHVVMVQSESFFDARALHPGVRRDILANFDALTACSLAHGQLRVPAWGANTIRTEFAVLAGENTNALGIHRYQPYWAVKRGLQVAALPSCLRKLGYRTIAVHPFPASFYARDIVYPRFGFERFLDLTAFNGAPRSGPYVSDLAVAEAVEALLRTATEPTFVFVVTMENHGPLHLEHIDDGDIAQLYHQPPPAGCHDLTAYLRHLRNADRMVAHLQQSLKQLERPTGLCWYGDHVPIMTSVYEALGEPPADTPYLIWRNDRQTSEVSSQPLAAHDLASTMLYHLGIRLPSQTSEQDE
jgi:hypothetical protein